jgi:hypothetical protein
LDGWGSCVFISLVGKAETLYLLSSYIFPILISSFIISSVFALTIGSLFSED